MLSQTFADWEAIVVDDGSTDGSFSNISSLVYSDHRFRIFRPEFTSQSAIVSGPYWPRNIALNYVRGSYVCFLDIDDFWFPDKLSKQYELIKLRPSAKLIFSNYYKANSCLTSGYLKPRFDLLSIKKQIYLWNPIPNLTSCVEASLAKSHQFEPTNHEDYIYWFRIVSVLTESQIYKITTPLALYRTASNSLSGNKFVVLLWWLECYKVIGHNYALSYLLLCIKIISELLEYLFFKLNIISTSKF